MSLEDRLVDHIAGRHTEEAALIVEHLPRAAAAELLGALDEAHFARLVDALPASTVAELLSAHDSDLVGERLSRCRPHAAAAVLRAMEAETAGRVLTAMPEPRRVELSALNRFARNTAAELMRPAAPLVQETATVERARALWSASPLRHREATLWIVDDEQRLVGEISAWALSAAPAADRISQHRRPPPPAVEADAAVDRVMIDPIWMERHTVPVVEKRRVVGALRWTALVRHQHLRADAGSSLETAGALRDLYRVVAQSVLAFHGGPGGTP